MEMEQMMEHLLAKMDAIQEKTNATIKEIIEDIRAWRKEMKSNQEATEAYPEKMEANPDEVKSVAEHEEVPKEEAAMETFRALKEWYENRHLAIRCLCQPKKRT
jgi:hypothetical protein